MYVRNTAYVPRNEVPSGSAGGKKAYLDKVIWRYIPVHEKAAEALAAGEVDWWDVPPLDFIPKIEQNPDLRTLVPDPLGAQGWRDPTTSIRPSTGGRRARRSFT
jgi:peptide/nickel transport system substrate-binding protein